MEGSRFSSGEVVSGAVLAGLGTFIIIEARGWVYVDADGPGPGFFPTWYGIAMVVLSLLLIAGSLRKARAAVQPVKWHEISRALFTWAAFAGSVALLKVLGFMLSFGLLTLFVVAVMYRRPLWTALAVAVGCSLGFYAVFALALDVGLPVGIFGF
ncbi:MAG: tripartite tricarboxylate transporter TctB family protein [Burkholderiales bacterium]|nr:tripartite tricarboxylate transporter TctB family protein [Burkholderiales bacterium]